MKLFAVGLLAAGALLFGAEALAMADVPKRAGESAKPENADGDEKTFAFEMHEKPWIEVFQWYGDNSGMQVIVSNKPRGVFTFIPSKGKRYTLTEIRDIINEAVFASHQMILVRGQRCCVLVPDEKIDGMSQLPRMRVNPEDLAKLGKYDLVHVVIKPTVMKAEDYREAETFLGPFGNLLILETVNKVIVVGLAGNLRDVMATIHDMETRHTEKMRLADTIIRQVEKIIDAVTR